MLGTCGVCLGTPFPIKTVPYLPLERDSEVQARNVPVKITARCTTHLARFGQHIFTYALQLQLGMVGMDLLNTARGPAQPQGP